MSVQQTARDQAWHWPWHVRWPFHVTIKVHRRQVLFYEWFKMELLLQAYGGQPSYVQDLIPGDVIDCILAKVSVVELCILSFVCKRLKKHCEKRKGHRTAISRQQYLTKIAASGNLKMIRWVLDYLGNYINVDVCCAAASSKYRVYPFILLTNHVRIISGGRQNVLEYILENRGRDDACWGPEVCSAAARGGHLSILQWLTSPLAAACTWDARDTFLCAAEGGHVNILNHLMQRLDRHDKHAAFVIRHAPYRAAANGHLQVLEYLYHHTSFVIEDDLSIIAAEGGHLHILIWIRKLYLPCSVKTCAGAAQRNHFEVLKWLREAGYPWNESTTAAAALAGNLEMLKWARSKGCRIDTACAAAAAGNGDIPMLEWLREEGCEWNASACEKAALNGQLDTLEWLREHGCEWNESACAAAAQTSRFYILQYLHESGCPWDHTVISRAAAIGNIKIIQYARERDCPWTGNALVSAVNANQYDTIDFLLANGCPRTTAFDFSLLWRQKGDPILQKYIRSPAFGPIQYQPWKVIT